MPGCAAPRPNPSGRLKYTGREGRCPIRAETSSTSSPSGVLSKSDVRGLASSSPKNPLHQFPPPISHRPTIPSGPGSGRLLVVYDGDCGICQAARRLLERLDRAQRLDFVTSDAAQGLVGAVDSTLFDRTIVVVDDGGRTHVEEAGVAEVIAQLPGGALVAWPLRLWGVRVLARSAYRWVSRNRTALSAALGFRACGRDSHRAT